MNSSINGAKPDTPGFYPQNIDRIIEDTVQLAQDAIDQASVRVGHRLPVFGQHAERESDIPIRSAIPPIREENVDIVGVL